MGAGEWVEAKHRPKLDIHHMCSQTAYLLLSTMSEDSAQMTVIERVNDLWRRYVANQPSHPWLIMHTFHRHQVTAPKDIKSLMSMSSLSQGSHLKIL